MPLRPPTSHRAHNDQDRTRVALAETELKELEVQKCGWSLNSTFLCPLRAHGYLHSVLLFLSQLQDHSGNGKNDRVTSMVTLKGGHQSDTSTDQEWLQVSGHRAMAVSSYDSSMYAYRYTSIW